MNNLRFKSFGARGATCQQQRIDQGLISIGGIPDDINPDFIYCNDSGYYDEAIKFKSEVAPNAKLILNVLDIPAMYIGKNFDLNKLYNQLLKADKITAVSQFVKSQIYHYLNFDSTCIYNPIMDIDSSQRREGIKKYNFRAMLVGRVNDPYKRGNLAIQSLQMAGFEEKDVVVVGSENPMWGTYLGVVSDSMLNELYNSVDFVLMCSNFEGLGLPGLEAMAAGAIPVVCHDLTTVSEFYPRVFWNYPSPQSISLFLKRFVNNPEFLKSTHDDFVQSSSYIINSFKKELIAQNILKVYNG